MKFCPQCKLEFEDETVFCTRDGSPLQSRVAKPGVMKLGSRASAGSALGVGALTSEPAMHDAGEATVSIPSMATMQAATVRVAPRAAPVPRPRVASEMQRTAPSPRRHLVDERGPDEDATSVLALPADESAEHSADFLDVQTVAMPAAPVAPPPEEPLPESDTPDLSGAVIAGRYRLLKRLGEGGMGVVYAALDERIEKQMAIKVLRDEFVRRSDVVARFTQEARSAGRIKHENVLDVTDYGRAEDNIFYIAMELLVGTDLADLLTREHTIAPERGIDIAIQICRALAAAHREGVVHRDLKPENVFLVRSDDGREVVKIVDFGIAQLKDGAEGGRKLTRTGMIFGTPEYMSPEQAAGKPIDLRVDVYATGVILYEMFTGRVPFDGETFMGVLTKHMFEPVPSMRATNPECAANEDLEAVIHKALSKDAALRYANMNELADDLTRVRSGLRPSAPVGYDGTGTFLRAQMLQGAGLSPGAIRPSDVQSAPERGSVSASYTQEAELAPPRSSRLGVWVAVIAGLSLAGVGVVWAFSQDTPVPPPIVAPTAPPPPSTVPPTRVEAPLPRPAANPAPAPAPVVDAGPPMMHLRVSTPGASAELRVGGEATPRCAATPCELSAPVGTRLELTARSGSRTHTVSVVVEREGQPVVIHLPAERSSRGSRSSHSRTPELVAPPVVQPVVAPTPPRHTGPRHCRGESDCDCIIERSRLLRPCL